MSVVVKSNKTFAGDTSLLPPKDGMPTGASRYADFINGLYINGETGVNDPSSLMGRSVTYTRNAQDVRINSAGQYETIAAGVAPIDYDPHSKRRLGLRAMVELANLMPLALTDGLYAASAASVAPRTDGFYTLTATGSGSAAHSITYTPAAPASAAWGVSIAARANAGRYIRISIQAADGSSLGFGDFDLIEGEVVSTSTAALRAGIAPDVSGSWRCSVLVGTAIMASCVISMLAADSTGALVPAFVQGGESVDLGYPSTAANSQGSFAGAETVYVPTGVAPVSPTIYFSGVMSLSSGSTWLMRFKVGKPMGATSVSRRNRIGGIYTTASSGFGVHFGYCHFLSETPGIPYVAIAQTDGSYVEYLLATTPAKEGDMLEIGVSISGTKVTVVWNGSAVGVYPIGALAAGIPFAMGARSAGGWYQKSVIYPVALPASQMVSRIGSAL